MIYERQRERQRTPAEIERRLDDCFELLSGGGRTVLPRQRTLRATVDWSYGLLAEPERALLRRLSVFAGGWTLEAAESVCRGEGIARPELLGLLQQLVDKSLVLAEEREGEASAPPVAVIAASAPEIPAKVQFTTASATPRASRGRDPFTKSTPMTVAPAAWR